jgi:DNA-binding LacI/PurR family transcriptional regulator
MSVRTIAEQAGVSISTVSRVLNNENSVKPETRERVIAVANELGYVATMGRRATTNLGFLYTGEPTIAHAYDAAVLGGVYRGTEEMGFDVILINLRRDKRPEETYTQFFMRKGVRGVIIRTMAEHRDVCRAIAAEGFPHVVISERFDDPKISFIDGESRADSTRAVNYLCSLGHRRIAFGVHNIPDRDHDDRLAGYEDALQANGLPIDEALIFRQPFTLAGGATIVQMALTTVDPPSAIYFADPMLAIGAIKKARSMGVRVPEDLSIIGFDDTDLRFGVEPTLTAVVQDASGLGFGAASWLTRRIINKSNDSLRRTVPTNFEICESTGPVGGGPRLATRSMSPAPRRPDAVGTGNQGKIATP